MRLLPCCEQCGPRPRAHCCSISGTLSPDGVPVSLCLFACSPAGSSGGQEWGDGAQLMKCLACEHEGLFDPLNPHSEKSWLW